MTHSSSKISPGSKFFSLILAFLLFGKGMEIVAQTTEKPLYFNPVIKGDFPDPSIIRVGNTYYAVGTSCDFAPNYPIYESTDLINWKQIGAVFQEPPKWTSDDFWAPELFYKDGTFFVYYTAKREDNRIACIGVATTRDIHKGFTDHGIIVEWGEEAIDSYVFQDDDGKLYIIWKAYGLTKGRKVELLASELNPDGLSMVGEPFTLTDLTKGWVGAGDEGPCMVNHAGYYYLFYSIGGCCDNRCNYRVMVARSKNLKTGWEQYSENPILEGGGVWKFSGHGTLVDTPNNRYFYLYHAYNSIDFEYIGRQGMLDEVVWNKQTGWPYFKNGKNPSVTAETPFKGTAQKNDSVWIDDFSSKNDQYFWEWDINLPKPSIKIAKGEMSITKGHNGISFLGLRPQSGDYQLMAKVIPTVEFSGIGIYSNQQNLIAFVANQSELVLYEIKKGEKEVLSKVNIKKSKSMFLKYEAVDGRYFRFFWSENGVKWIPVKENVQVDGTFVAQWGCSPRVGFIIDGKECSTSKFSELKIQYNQK